MLKQTRPRGLVIHRLADKSSGTRIVRFDPDTGERKLVNPATPGEAHEPWPLAGIELLGAPELTTISTQLVDQGISEGWLTGTGERVVARPGGEPGNEWRTDKLHTFRHFDTFTFHTVEGDVTYKVVHQPDKYADYEAATYPDAVEEFAGDDDAPVTPEIYEAGATRVDHFYGLERKG